MRSIFLILFFIFLSSTVFAKSNDANSGSTRRIFVTSANYGAGTKTCNATSAVQLKCNSTRSCSIEANNKLCGDPAPNVSKELNVSYFCSDKMIPRLPMQQFAYATEGQLAYLSC